MYSTGPNTSTAWSSLCLWAVELYTEGRESVPMMGEGPRESCDLLIESDTSTRELLVLMFAAFSSSHTRDGDHFTKFLSSRIESV